MIANAGVFDTTHRDEAIANVPKAPLRLPTFSIKVAEESDRVSKAFDAISKLARPIVATSTPRCQSIFLPPAAVGASGFLLFCD